MARVAALLLLASTAWAQGAEARRLLNEGAALAQKGEYPKAREKLQRAFAIYDKSKVRAARMGAMSALSWIAYCYQGEKDWKNTVKYRRAALERTRNLFPGDHPNVEASLRHLAVNLAQAGETKQAMVRFREAAAMQRRILPDRLALRIKTLGTMISWLPAGSEEAMRLAEERIGLAKRAGDMDALLGSIGELMLGGRYKRALALAEEAQKLAKGIDRATAALQRAQCLHYLGKLKEAAALCDRFLPEARGRAGGDRFGLLLNASMIYADAGRPRRALRLAEEACGVDPKHPVPLLRKAGALSRLGRGQEAIDCAQRLLALRPEAATRGAAHNLIGINLRRLGRPREALVHYRKCLELGNPRAALVHNNIGVCYQALGEHKQALMAFERAVEADPAVAEAHHGMARIFSDTGQPEQACAAERRAIAAAKRLPETPVLALATYQAHLARFLYQAGRVEDSRALLAEAGRLAVAAVRAGAVDWSGGLDSIVEHFVYCDQAALGAALLERAVAKDPSPDLMRMLAVCLGRAGRPQDAIRWAQRAVRGYEALYGGAEPLHAKALLALAHTMTPAEALPLLRTALAIQERVAPGDHALTASLLRSVGFVLSALGRSKEGVVPLRAAVAMLERLGSGPRELGGALQSLGVIEIWTGEEKQALKHVRRALELLEKAEDGPASIGYTRGTLGAILGELGRHELAVAEYERALALIESVPSAHAELAVTLTNSTYPLLDLGRHKEARVRLERALAIGRERRLGGSFLWAGLLARLLLDVEKDPAAALPLVREAVAGAEKTRLSARGLDEFDRAQLMSRIDSHDNFALATRVLLALGRADEALDFVERGRARALLDLLARSRFEPLREAEARARLDGDDAVLARIAKVREELAASERAVSEATFEAMAAPSDRELAKRAKQAQERHREAVATRAQLVRQVVPLARPADAARIRAGLRKEERLVCYVVSKKKAFCMVVPPAGQEIYSEELVGPEGAAVTREALGAEVERFLAGLSGGGTARGMRQKTGATRQVFDVGRLSAMLLPEGVRERLRGVKRVILLPHDSLHRVPFEALAFGKATWLEAGPEIVYAPSATVWLWCATRRNEQAGRARGLELVALGDPRYTAPEDTPQPPKAGVFLKVVRDAPGLQAGDVLLAYDGKQLRDYRDLRRQVDEVRYAIEDHERGADPVEVKFWRAGTQKVARVAPGLLDVEVARISPQEAWADVRRAASPRVSRFAPLPGTRREVEAIAKLFKRSRVLLGDQATEPRLFEAAPRARYLHLATHLLSDETEHQSYSALALTLPRWPNPDDDGFLRLADLLERWRDRLSGCELVVLSACETHTGPLQKNEGPYALPVGFLFAGAPAVIASLWRVDDASTAELFADFYARLAKGTPKLQAFVEARRALRKKYPAPYHWAPFVYIGDPR